jgi:plastocyanin
MVIGAILIAAIAQPAATASTGSTTPGGEPVVHMGPGNFLQSSVSVPKGSKLLLVDDGSFLHILTNGSWQNGQPKPAKEPQAPSVNNVQVNGNSIEIGPFTTAGTYHIYCTVHQGMNLTVIVS